MLEVMVAGMRARSGGGGGGGEVGGEGGSEGGSGGSEGGGVWQVETVPSTPPMRVGAQEQTVAPILLT
jgi:hypothetical protein